MKKRYIFSAAGLLGASALVSYIGRNMANKREKTSTVAQAGMPDQVDKEDLAQLENAKMVSEGSQYGVRYYNELQENEINH